MNNADYKVIVVSHTHWDRAWYVPFQEFRVRLVRLLDRLLTLLESDSEYRYFMLDGQMVVLEDYLEVKPENRERIKRLVQEGRLQIGPWYVLADEFLVSPESLIRNLQLGHRLAEELGGVEKLGYVPDAFGHIAQLPLILNGFDIDNAQFWRGLDDTGEMLGTEFVWEALDGSQVTSIWFRDGYNNGSNLGYPMRWGDTSMMRLDDDMAIQQIQDRLEVLKPYTNTNALLIMNGIDHSEAEPELPRLLQLAKERLGLDIQHGKLSEYLDLIKGIELPLHKGEFRWGRYEGILQGVYSSRIKLKQRNNEVQNLLEAYAEPLSAMAYALGAEYPGGLLWTAWRWLMKNHPHDDICGCSVDQVHDEMLYRFTQAEQIGRVIARDAFRSIAQKVDWSAHRGIPIIVYNPNNWRREDIATGKIIFDEDDDTARSFQIINGDGEVIPHQVLGSEVCTWMEVLKPIRKRVVRVAFPVNVPSMGYETYWVEARTKTQVETKAKVTPSDLQVEKAGAANEYLAFRINANGTIDMEDKETGVLYKELHLFEDTEDAGDEYSYSHCSESRTITSRQAQAGIECLWAGPIQCTFRVTVPMQLPTELSADRQRRADELEEINIVSDITLYARQKGLFVRTYMDNRVKDHRLRVHFPTGIKTDHAYADGHFGVIKRSLDLPNAEGWAEQPSKTMHQREFVDISDGKLGLAVVNKGLPEYEIIRDEAGTSTIALTLLRSVGWLSRDDLLTRNGNAGPMIPAPGAQCQGWHEFEYVLMPHSGDWREVVQRARQVNRPLLVARADLHEGFEEDALKVLDTRGYASLPNQFQEIAPEGELASAVSFVQNQRAEVLLTALKKSEKSTGLIVRLHNTSDDTIRDRLSCSLSIQKAYVVNLNEERRQLLPMTGNCVEFEVKGNSVVTLELIL